MKPIALHSSAVLSCSSVSIELVLGFLVVLL